MKIPSRALSQVLPQPLTGDIIFYDKKVSGTCKQMGAVRCPAVTAEWSPDGRWVLMNQMCESKYVDQNV